ncbi:phospholipase A, partial [Pseudomaricurvus sp.]|uniref:phospholipase A n=1 Tax=Pseudomaricurvus sp. TaxID=2004510 RepID=UPI003F6B7724
MRPFVFLLLATTFNTHAETQQECRSIEEDTARLSCYDQLFGVPEAEIKEAIAKQSTSESTAENIPPAEEVSDVEVRLNSEDQLADNRFVILPHRQTYILPYTYLEDPNGEPYSSNLSLADESLDNEEIKFQISLKVPIAKDFLFDKTTLWMGYTQVSLWQAYNGDASAPFRETNYEPEIYWSFPTRMNVFGATLEETSVGFVHQSNGRGEPLSRSWNRIFANFVFARNQWGFTVKPWYRIPEDEKDDDNPDIEAYLGYADFIATYKWDEDFVLSALVRNNFRSKDNHTSTTLSLSFPLPGRLNGYIEYVDGYG